MQSQSLRTVLDVARELKDRSCISLFKVGCLCRKSAMDTAPEKHVTRGINSVLISTPTTPSPENSHKRDETLILVWVARPFGSARWN